MPVPFLKRPALLDPKSGFPVYQQYAATATYPSVAALSALQLQRTPQIVSLTGKLLIICNVYVDSLFSWVAVLPEHGLLNLAFLVPCQIIVCYLCWPTIKWHFFWKSWSCWSCTESYNWTIWANYDKHYVNIHFWIN